MSAPVYIPTSLFLLLLVGLFTLKHKNVGLRKSFPLLYHFVMQVHVGLHIQIWKYFDLWSLAPVKTLRKLIGTRACAQTCDTHTRTHSEMTPRRWGRHFNCPEMSALPHNASARLGTCHVCCGQDTCCSPAIWSMFLEVLGGRMSLYGTCERLRAHRSPFPRRVAHNVP